MMEYIIKTGSKQMHLTEVKKLLEQTYWAKDRSMEVIRISIENSLCFGVFTKENQQIGFARVITDFATTYYICDVIVDQEWRGMGIGKAIMECIESQDILLPLRGILATKDAQKFYEAYGFIEGDTHYMGKRRK